MIKSVDRVHIQWHTHIRAMLVAISALLIVFLGPSSLARLLELYHGDRSITIGLWDGRVYFAAAVILTPLLLILHPESFLRRTLYYLPLVLLFLAYRAPLGSREDKSTSTGAYQFGILLASWTMRILDRLYINDPEEAFRYMEHEDGVERPKTSPRTYSPMKKLAWAVELMVVTRGVGWNWQIQQIPKQPRLSRTSLVLRKLQSAAFTIATLQMIRVSSSALIRLSMDVSSGTRNEAWTAVFLHPVFLHIFMYTAWAFVVYSSLNLPENIFAMIFVGLGISQRWSQPEMWPPVFGQLRDSYSIRRSWGLFWHQNMRRVCQSPSMLLVQNVASLKTPSTKQGLIFRRYFCLLITFLFSGFIHAGGSIYMTQRSGKVHDGGNIIGFVYQGLALIAEDAILAFLGIDDSKPASLSRRMIGYILVHGYASYATPKLKVMALARDSGLDVVGGPLLAGVKMVGLGALGVLKNPFATMIGSLN